MPDSVFVDGRPSCLGCGVSRPMTQSSLYLINEAATRQLGEDLALSIRAGDCIALSGDLGAGKSTLARALIRAFADDDVLEVPSPTFTLVQTYEARLPISHFDLYRLADPSELDELGLDEALENGIALIEWPERAGENLPANLIRIAFSHEASGRRVAISGPSTFTNRLERVLSIRQFLDQRGYPHAHRRFLTGDSSFRGYERLTTEDGRKFIVMDSPARPNGPVIRDGKPYSQLVHLAEDVRPFIAIGRYLKSLGLSAPAIYETDISQGILLIEDLGSLGMLDSGGKPIAERFEQAVGCLAAFQQYRPPAVLPVEAGETHIIPHFDRTTLKYEIELLLDWHIPWKRGRDATDEERADYLAIWDDLLDQLDESEKNLVLRDYHSPNLIWLPERHGNNRVGILDFQDAIIGPTAYDVVSLVQDARVTVERPLMDHLLETYLRMRESQGPFDRQRFLKSWAIMSAQRACRLNGLWVRLLKRDNMPGYMRHMERTLWHLEVAFEHPVNAPLREWVIKAGILPAESIRA